jgi:hypothetical protein
MQGRGNGGAVQSVERGSCPTLRHRPLEDAGEAGVSHIPTALDDGYLSIKKP